MFFDFFFWQIHNADGDGVLWGFSLKHVLLFQCIIVCCWYVLSYANNMFGNLLISTTLILPTDLKKVELISVISGIDRLR